MKKNLSVLLMCLLLTGCASIVSKSVYDVSIQSSPADANFTVTNRAGIKVFEGSTPMSVSLPASSGYFKNESYVISVSKNGYPEKTVSLTSSLDGWYWGNILVGGFLGMLVVDPISGAMYKLPSTVDIALEDDDSSVAATNLHVLSLDQLSEAQRSRLEKLN